MYLVVVAISFRTLDTSSEGFIVGLIAIAALLLAIYIYFKSIYRLTVSSAGIRIGKARFIPSPDIDFENSLLRQSLCTIQQEDLEIEPWHIGKKNWLEVIDTLKKGAIIADK